MLRAFLCVVKKFIAERNENARHTERPRTRDNSVGSRHKDSSSGGDISGGGAIDEWSVIAVIFSCTATGLCMISAFILNLIKIRKGLKSDKDE